MLEDFLGGASQDSAASDALPPVGGLPGEVEPPQSLVAREDTFQADIDVEANSGISQDLEDAMDLVCDEQNIRLERARKRRLLPGADTTMHDFQKFFGDLFEVAEHRLADVPQLACEDEPSIPDRISRVRAIIARKFPRLDEALMRLVTGAVIVNRLRLTDLHLRELVMLLWIIEGERHMRCHDGNLYFFNLGAFALRKGVPPQATLARCKRFFMQLEGLFRLMGAARLSTDDDVLESVRGLLQSHNHSARELLLACEDAASGHIPGPGKGRRVHNRADAEMEGEEAAPGPASDGRCAGLAGRPCRRPDQGWLHHAKRTLARQNLQPCGGVVRQPADIRSRHFVH